jgi:hypothetical protein
MRALTIVVLACVTLSGCDISKSLARYPPPPAGSFTAVTVQVSADGTSESTPGATVAPDFFRGYSVQPLIGRAFMAPDEYAQNASRTVLLSEDLWRKRFGAAPDVIGRNIDIDGAPTTVVGVIPNTFQQPPGAKFWLPSHK